MIEILLKLIAAAFLTWGSYWLGRRSAFIQMSPQWESDGEKMIDAQMEIADLKVELNIVKEELASARVGEAFKQLEKDQVPLGPEFEQVLYDNLNDLYER